MAVEINWDDDQRTIVRMKLIGRWGWEDAYEGSKQGYDLLDSVDHVVNVIIDMRQSTGLPLLAMTHARNMIAKRHPRTGMTVFLGVNSLFLTLWKAFAKSYPQVSHSNEFTFARSDEEARRILSAPPDAIHPV